MARRGLLLLLVVVGAALAVAQEYGYEEYGYDEYYDEYDEAADEYGYYEDDDEAYYEYYGYYADDEEGEYDDYYEYYEEYYDELGPGGPGGFTDCVVDDDGKFKLANGTAPCDLRLQGLDKQADLLTGGLDGVYKLVSCHNNKPMYRRVDSPAGEDRVLWYSNGFGDWDISKGSEPNEAEIYMYGGEVQHASTPLFVSAWYLGADLMTIGDMGDDEYMPVEVNITCADGKVYKEPEGRPSTVRAGPVLTDDEIESKYRYIYERYGRRPEPNPSVNFTFVVLLVMTGLTIVLAIPYFLLRKGRGKAGGQAPIAASFASIIQQSKKKQSGHFN